MTVLYYPTSLCMTTLYQLLVVADYSVYDSPLLPESVYDYPLPLISIGYYSVYDSPLLFHESVYDYTLPIISIGLLFRI